MAFSNKSQQEAMSEINVTPLVDVMLVLLVVFIVTAPLLTQSVKVNLPKTASASTAPIDHILTLSIDSKGELFINAEKVDAGALPAKLKDRLDRDPELIVQFNADSGVAYGRVAEVMADAQRVGITRLSFLTQERR